MPPPDRLDLLVRRTRAATPFVGSWVRRRAAWRLWSRGTPDALARLATVVVETEDPKLRRYAVGLLGRVGDARRADAVVAVWADTRSPVLGALIEQKRWLAADPVGLRVLTALFLGLHDGMHDAPAPAVPPLLAASLDADLRVAERAAFVLRTLARDDARQAVCDAYLDEASGPAERAAIAGGYEPANPVRRALFYFLTGQWQRYEGLDFDGSFLRSAYEVAGADLRRRLAGVARRAGRIEFVAAAAREGRRVGEMTDVEWESAVAVLAGTRRWPDLWRLAQAAPPRWAAAMILRLAAEDWEPPAGGASTPFADLVESARAWVDPDTQYDSLGDFVGGGGDAASGRADAGRVGPVAVSPDGRMIVAANGSGPGLGGTDRSVSIWRPGDPRAMVRQVGQVPTHLAIGPDGRTLAVGGADGAVTLWGLPEGRQIAR
ncbi:MAG: repeat, subgroup, partial [Phycisphaerales bacterium]|nr:repeat, subgroup [Phycisphaerales bacterium]